MLEAQQSFHSVSSKSSWGPVWATNKVNSSLFFPKITGSQRMCCHPWPWICRSQCISFTQDSKKGFLLRKENIRYWTCLFYPDHNIWDTFPGLYLQEELFLYEAPQVCLKAHRNHSALPCFAFLLLMNCHTWLPCSSGFLNTSFSCPWRAAL